MTGGTLSLLTVRHVTTQ